MDDLLTDAELDRIKERVRSENYAVVTVRIAPFLIEALRASYAALRASQAEVAHLEAKLEWIENGLDQVGL